jgi:hypothetical protein
METKSEGVAIAVAKTSETETKHVVAPETSGPAVVVEEFPDPEEDDLDDLDGTRVPSMFSDGVLNLCCRHVR